MKPAYAAALAVFPVILPLSTGRADPGREAYFDVSQGLQYTEQQGNFTTVTEQPGWESRTGLSFGLIQEARSQRLAFAIGTDLLYNFSNSQEFDTDNTFGRLSYDLTTRRAALNFTTFYREVDVDKSIFLEDVNGTNTSVDTGNGTRRIFGTHTGLTLGRDEPLSFNLEHRYSQSNYYNTDDPGLLDSTTQFLNAVATLQLSAVTSVNAFASWQDFDEQGQNGTKRTTNTVGIGTSYDLSPTRALTGEITYADIETNTGATGTGGPGFVLGLTDERPNGEVELALSTTQTVNGWLNQASLDRGYDFRRGTALLSLGLANSDLTDFQPLIGAVVDYELTKLSSVNLGLTQTIETDNDDNESLLTRLRLGYRRDLTRNSALTGNLQYAREGFFEPGDGDNDTIRFEIAYRHSLDQDWDLVSAYQYFQTQGTDVEDRQSGTVYLGIERSFRFRP